MLPAGEKRPPRFPVGVTTQRPGVLRWRRWHIQVPGGTSGPWTSCLEACVCVSRGLCCLCCLPWGLAWPEKVLPELPSRGLSCHHSVFTTDSYMASCASDGPSVAAGAHRSLVGVLVWASCASWVRGRRWCAPAVRAGEGAGAGVRQPC